MVVKEWERVQPTLSTSVLNAIRKMSFKTMTPVQAAVIPLLTTYKDVVAEAVTGSGKTLAFVVPLMEILLKKHRNSPFKKEQVGAVVISPTRELASQISEVIDSFLLEPELALFTKILLVGGQPIEEDVKLLTEQGSNIIVCTPGRFEDLLTRKFDFNLPQRLKELELLVLDEADRLLDLGFSTSLTTILSYLPRQRRTGLFSATQTKQLEDLVRAGLRNPVVVSVKEKSTISTPLLLENYYAIIEPQDKLIFLINFIRKQNMKKCLFFLPTCACVDYFGDILPSLLGEKKIFALHGKMKKKRGKVLEDFRNSEKAVLLCTDLLARGLDIPEVDWVLQWEPPTNPSALVHRVGRTARGGATGASLLPLLPSEDSYIRFIKINQMVELNEYKGPAKNLTDKMRKKMLAIIHEHQRRDRGVLDKGLRAFVSHMRAYTKHECNLLLQFKQLPLGHIATSYGLLKLPLMPEIKAEHKTEFLGPNEKIDLNSIPYKDKQKEFNRLKKLEEFRKSGVWPSKSKIRVKKSQPWEQSNLNKEDKKERKKRRTEARNNHIESGIKGKKRKKQVTQEELDDLAKDIALLKKLKKRKISDEQFNKEFEVE